MPKKPEKRSASCGLIILVLILIGTNVVTMDSRIEIPLYDDNWDEIPSSLGNVIGTDAICGNGIFL